MPTDKQLPLSDEDIAHQSLMRDIARDLSDTPYILKGGTALLLTRGLKRHSTDLDFDSDKKLNIAGRIERAMERQGAEISSLNLVKNTDTVQRFKVHYINAAGSNGFLKIETSFRDAHDPATVETIDGIRTYDVPTIFDQKMNAFENRTTGRDLYDLAHLMNEFRDRLSPEQITRIDAATQDLDALATNFEDVLKDDPVLRGISSEELVLQIRDGIERGSVTRMALVQSERETIQSEPIDRQRYVVVTGPNGAGKSTLADEMIRTTSLPRLDPDRIARSIKPHDPESASIEAGRVTLAAVEKHIQRGESFVQETTLSGSQPLRTAELAKEAGYRVEQYFVGLDSSEFSKQRVAQRVSRGGHHIPDDVIDRRFPKTFENAVELAQIADKSRFYDNASRTPHKLVLAREGRKMSLAKDAPPWAREIHERLIRLDRTVSRKESEQTRLKSTNRKPSGIDR